MTSWAEEVLAMAKKLPREDQLRIAQRLVSEASAPSADVQAAWHQEIADRLEALERGDAELVDADEVFARVRGKLAR